MAKFPRAGQLEPKADDPMMKRVQVEHSEIGARRSGMPDNLMNDQMKIVHSGGAGRESGGG